MKEYEIENNNKLLGKVKVFEQNIKEELKNSIIYSNNYNYETIKEINKYQTYLLSYIINNIDDLYDIVKLYYNGDFYEEIENIKSYNNIKKIKKDTKVDILIPSIYLNYLNINKKNIDLNSLLNSKLTFIKNSILNNSSISYLKDTLNSIIDMLNNITNSNEYEFFTDDEKRSKLHELINWSNNIIKQIEIKTNFKYEKDFIIPIIINN